MRWAAAMLQRLTPMDEWLARAPRTTQEILDAKRLLAELRAMTRFGYESVLDLTYVDGTLTTINGIAAGEWIATEHLYQAEVAKEVSTCHLL
jgi:hypothetical protein